MSGIVGVIDLRGKPVDGRLLQSMTLQMTQRGPDGQQIWSQGHVGLGHAMLHTSIDTPATAQPCSLDGRTWITADARVDCREELIAALGAGCEKLGRNPSDVELLLAAYRKWGSDCVQHLQGDFSFAIWDGIRQQLFCARDHFGIKPFYYCRAADCVIFGNTLDSLKLHPQVSSSLDEQAVADFLLFGFSIHPRISVFQDIQKLPAGHTLTLGANASLRCRKYWNLPVEQVRRFKQADACIEEYSTIFHQAVNDRLRTDRVGILMSGGLDSTSIAAVARKCLADQYDQFDLRAFTFVYEWLIADQEAVFSQQAAETIGIPVHQLNLDAYGPCDVFGAAHGLRSLLESSFTTPADSAGATASRYSCRVGICGHGGDELFHPGFTDLKGWLQTNRLAVLALEAFKYWRKHRRMPAIGLRTAVRKALGKNHRTRQPIYPPWLHHDFERRLNLKQQWQAYHSRPHPAETPRSAAVDGLNHPLWHNMFESYDPGITGIPVELRYPFLDLRLISFCLQLPAIPWCVDKLLLRRAGRDMLPDTVQLRPKTPLTGFPDYEHLLRRTDAEMTNTFLPDEFEAFIDMQRYRKIAGQPQKLRPGEHTLITHPLRLARWLQYLEPGDSKNTGRLSWQILKKSRTEKKPIIPPACASMETSTV